MMTTGSSTSVAISQAISVRRRPLLSIDPLGIIDVAKL
jgi:hypothetical protein